MQIVVYPIMDRYNRNPSLLQRIGMYYYPINKKDFKACDLHKKTINLGRLFVFS